MDPALRLLKKINGIKFSYWFLILLFFAFSLSACQPDYAFMAANTPGIPSGPGELTTPTKNTNLADPRNSTAETSSSAPQPSPTHSAAKLITASATPTKLQPTSTPSQPPITRMIFTGVVVPARCVQAKLDEIGDLDYPYHEVREILSGADLAVGSFNATMSDQVVHTGCVWTYQLVGSPENADALARAGFDLMSVATNHIKDCGLMKGWCDDVFFDTLENLTRVKILTVGAGENLADALQPVIVTINGIRFGFVSLGDSKLSETVFAAEDHPGIALLTEQNMRQAIEKARQMADYG